MARKGNAAVTTETTTEAALRKVATPEGFEDVSSDIEAVYDFKHTPEPIYVRPKHYTLSDAKDGSKPAILIHAELMQPAPLVDMKDDSEESVVREYPAGTMIGIWYRPGLRQIMQCAGAVTFVAHLGKQDTGNPFNKMEAFKVARAKGEKAEQLSCSADYRKKTRGMALPWDDKGAVAQSAARGGTQPGPNDTDDIPF